MSKLYNRMKGAIQRNLYYRQQYYDPESYEEEGADSPERLDENEFDNTNDAQTNKNTPLRAQAKGRVPLDEGPPAPSVNPSNSQVRPVPDAIQSTTNVNPPVTTNTVPTPGPPAPTSLPNPDPYSRLPTSLPNPDPSRLPSSLPNSDPSSRLPTSLPNPNPSSRLPTNPTQPLSPSMNRVPQSSVRANFPSLRDRKRRPFMINSDSQLVGFPRSQHFLPASFTPRPQPRRSFLTRPPPPRTNMSNLEIDYPIENVFINENIPSSMAMKINEAVEHDRFDDTYYTHRYAYKPKTQYISIGNNRHLECRLVENDQQMGVRYIREINYPSKQNLNNVQIIIDNTPSQLNYFPTPIHHFIAHALPNDPMRYY